MFNPMKTVDFLKNMVQWGLDRALITGRKYTGTQYQGDGTPTVQIVTVAPATPSQGEIRYAAAGWTVNDNGTGKGIGIVFRDNSKWNRFALIPYAGGGQTIADGVAYQNTSDRSMRMYVSCTFNPTSSGAATFAYTLGTWSPGNAIFTDSVPAGSIVGAIRSYFVEVPPGWFYSFTAVNGTLATTPRAFF